MLDRSILRLPKIQDTLLTCIAWVTTGCDHFEILPDVHSPISFLFIVFGGILRRFLIAKSRSRSHEVFGLLTLHAHSVKPIAVAARDS